MAQHVHLTAGGVSLVIAPSLPETPIVYWGEAISGALPAASDLSLATPHGGMDDPRPVGIHPSGAHAWRGRPGMRGSRDDGSGFSPQFVLAREEHDQRTCQLEWTSDSGLVLHTRIELDEHGVLQIGHRLENIGADDYRLDSLDTVLPLSSEATDSLDFTGRWAREAQPQRGRITDGTWVRTGRHGRTGHDHSLLLAAGTPGFSYEKGRVWAIHLAWSGDHERFIERTPQPATLIGAGELLRAGEIVLKPGGSHTTPTLYAACSSHGLNGIASRFHRHLRSRPAHPATPRPVVLNTWEAVYFDHSLDRLSSLADEAAAIGVERFVLDDGWFAGRRDDQRALGDWSVDSDVWGHDIDILIGRVHALGMEFGLWFEPEMISLDSDLARTHPAWVQRADGDRLPAAWRSQYAVDLLAAGASEYLFTRLDELLRVHAIDFVKWDFNRDNLEQSHDGRASGHEQTLAFYALLDRLRAAHPDVEFESCASGGARADLGVLARTDRVWISDTNDALERQRIQQAFTLLLPPELLGSHVSSSRSHTTGRRHDMSFRALTAMFGSFGIEADLGQMDGDLAELAESIELYKTHRTLLHSGTVVEADTAHDSLRVHGVVAGDRKEALYAVVALGTLGAEQPGFVRLPGLDGDIDYEVNVIFPTRTEPALERRPPGWVAGGTRVSGSYLDRLGLTMPVLLPEHGILIHCTAVDPSRKNPV